MKSALLALSFILVFPSLQVCRASFANDNNPSYGQALVALKEVKRRLNNFVNRSSNVGKIANEMLRIIDFAELHGFTKDDSKTVAYIDHLERGAFASFQELIDEDLSNNFSVEYQQTQYNSHITVSIKYPDIFKSTNFFGQNSKQFKVTLYSFECGSNDLQISVGETKIDSDGICQEITRVWSLEDSTEEFNWDTGFSEYFTKYLFP
ncbi:MAG: hypothetical protein AB8G05_09430 [Oligoflexales bacterium]